ncbi:MAG: LysR substrate-binding domain-containing protein [Pseudomonadota bacterium]
MNLRQLEAFAAVMSAGSITGAARLLDRSQPAVTRLIKELEASVGFTLFDRTGARVTPTSRALQLHEEVDRSLIGLSRIQERAAAIARAEERALRIAAIPALATSLVPAALATLDRLPEQVSVRSTAAEEIIRSVLDLTIDIGLASLPIDHPGLTLHWVVDAGSVAVVKSDDPLADRPVIALSDLAERRIITMTNPYRLRRRVDRALTAAGIDPALRLETNGSIYAMIAARHGLGVALVERMTALSVPMEGVVARPIDHHIPFLWGVVTPAARPPDAAVAALIDALSDTLATTMPDMRKLDPGALHALGDAVFGPDIAEDLVGGALE